VGFYTEEEEERNGWNRPYAVDEGVIECFVDLDALDTDKDYADGETESD